MHTLVWAYACVPSCKNTRIILKNQSFFVKIINKKKLIIKYNYDIYVIGASLGQIYRYDSKLYLTWLPITS